MQLTQALVGLLALALGTNAATINTRQDPVLFTYQVQQGGNCSTIDWNLSDFHQSQLPASKCVVISDLVGSAPATAFILVETQAICRVVLFDNASCSGQGNPTLTSLHCSNGAYKSFRVEGTAQGC